MPGSLLRPSASGAKRLLLRVLRSSLKDVLTEMPLLRSHDVTPSARGAGYLTREAGLRVPCVLRGPFAFQSAR